MISYYIILYNLNVIGTLTISVPNVYIVYLSMPKYTLYIILPVYIII